jgi:hypothetical protein
MIFKLLDTVMNSQNAESLAKPDAIVDSVISKYKERSRVGVKKYGKTLEKNNLTLLEWLNHLQEELMDATLYIEKLKNEINER